LYNFEKKNQNGGNGWNGRMCIVVVNAVLKGHFKRSHSQYINWTVISFIYSGIVLQLIISKAVNEICCHVSNINNFKILNQKLSNLKTWVTKKYTIFLYIFKANKFITKLKNYLMDNECMPPEIFSSLA
jgi:hypothetical protein